MNKSIKYRHFIFSILLVVISFSSCKKLYNTDQALNITESKLYGDWYEYRSAAMGLYGLQQKLVEQLLLLGELRGDLLTITPNADADMIEISNFNVSKTNKYASPTNFFKLISACNNFLRIVKSKHPEVLDPNSPISNYDRIYGEALCMRAWAYFNAARIYGKVPYIHEQLSTMEDIEGYVNSSGSYKDSVYINYNIDGFHNDTIRIDTVLTKQYYDLPMVIDVFTNQLEQQIKFQSGTFGVGVNYAADNGYNDWEATTWHPYSMHALLGQMYLTRGNYAKAHDNFYSIMVNNTTGNTGSRYDLTSSFAGLSWINIFNFRNIDIKEHVFIIPFSKDNFQQNQINTFFINKFMLKPTLAAVSKWENCWRGQVLNRNDSRPELTTMVRLGIPGDYYRGYGLSYLCLNLASSVAVGGADYYNMLALKSKGDFRGANAIMDGTDTIVLKYFQSSNASLYSQDADYMVYRAAGIHLYMAEIYVYWEQNGLFTNQLQTIGILNDGSFMGYGATQGRTELGVRGRVGLGSGEDGISIKNVIYSHDPLTNKITGYRDYSSDLKAKQEYLEDQVMNERALELAFEGERFYDLMRVAKRRNDPSYLASRVSAKYPAGQREAIYNYLLDENNWYINYFK